MSQSNDEIRVLKTRREYLGRIIRRARLKNTYPREKIEDYIRLTNQLNGMGCYLSIPDYCMPTHWNESKPNYLQSDPTDDYYKITISWEKNSRTPVDFHQKTRQFFVDMGLYELEMDDFIQGYRVSFRFQGCDREFKILRKSFTILLEYLYPDFPQWSVQGKYIEKYEFKSIY